MMNLLSFFLPLAFLPLTLSAAVIYSESTQGDLSDVPEAPSLIGALALGESTIEGSINEDAFGSQPDVFEFIVSEGQQLDSLTISVSSTARSHFLALLDSSVSFFEDDFAFFATLVSSGDMGVNLLVQEAAGGIFADDVAASGVDLPLPAGRYGLWLQETTEDDEVEYSFTLQTSTVPEPSGAALLLSASLCLLRRRGNH